MIFAIRFAMALLKVALRDLQGTWLETKHLVQEHPPPKGSGCSLAFIYPSPFSIAACNAYAA